MNAQEIAGIKKREQIRSYRVDQLSDLMSKGSIMSAPRSSSRTCSRKWDSFDLHECRQSGR
jgi:hypothetical protein